MVVSSKHISCSGSPSFRLIRLVYIERLIHCLPLVRFMSHSSQTPDIENNNNNIHWGPSHDVTATRKHLQSARLQWAAVKRETDDRSRVAGQTRDSCVAPLIACNSIPITHGEIPSRESGTSFLTQTSSQAIRRRAFVTSKAY